MILGAVVAHSLMRDGSVPDDEGLISTETRVIASGRTSASG